jgi:hypothetical protein
VLGGEWAHVWIGGCGVGGGGWGVGGCQGQTDGKPPLSCAQRSQLGGMWLNWPSVEQEQEHTKHPS